MDLFTALIPNNGAQTTHGQSQQRLLKERELTLDKDQTDGRLGQNTTAEGDTSTLTEAS